MEKKIERLRVYHMSLKSPLHLILRTGLLLHYSIKVDRRQLIPNVALISIFVNQSPVADGVHLLGTQLFRPRLGKYVVVVESVQLKYLVVEEIPATVEGYHTHDPF